MKPCYDLLVVVDAIGSMGKYLEAMRMSIPEILALSRLSGTFQRIGVIAYIRDYCSGSYDLLEWSGWNADLVKFVSTLSAKRGRDVPGAGKTALTRALYEVQKGGRRNTLVLWYTDAPPHHASDRHSYNAPFEIQALGKEERDWVRLSLQARERNLTVFSFLPSMTVPLTLSSYVFLSHVTGGICVTSCTDCSAISRLTMELILKWMGCDVTVDAESAKADIMRWNASPLECPRLASSDVPLSRLATSPLYLSERYRTVPDYRREVCVNLSAIIRSRAVVLTYNAIFRELWRAVCAQPGSMEHAKLLITSSKVLASVNDPVEKVMLQTWFEDSFDGTAEIERIIGSAEPDCPRIYLDLDTNNLELTRVELLKLSMSCHADSLKELATIFAHIKIIKTGIPLAPCHKSIPLTLPPQDLFCILPHLAVPGTLYPPRSAMLVAVLSLTMGVTVLRDPAIQLLATQKGTWTNLDVPENMGSHFARFLMSAPAGFVLTDQERMFYEGMNRYRSLEQNLQSTMRLRVPWTPRLKRQVGDHKIQCQSCGVRRSVTLMSHAQKDVCGLCIGCDYSSRFQDGGEVNSCWIECSVNTCRAQYVIEDAQRLRGRPKCYYCRSHIPCPWVECARCTNRIILPKFYRQMTGEYVCPACDTAENEIETTVSCETTPEAMIAENGFSWLGLKPFDGMFRGRSAYKLVRAHGHDIFRCSPKEEEVQLTLRGKRVRNSSAARAQIEDWVESGHIELGTCHLCLDEVVKGKLLATCGRRGCRHRACRNCLKKWYDKSQPGALLNVTHLTCPLCRRNPAPQVLSRYNRRALALRNLQNAMDDRKYFYGWCLDCNAAKRAIDKVCAEADLPTIEGFRCADCVQRRTTQPIPVTECPNCSVSVEKTGGCNHIQCVCGTHFCHVCGAGHVSWKEEDCYAHMANEHGGIYDADQQEEEDDICAFG